MKLLFTIAHYYKSTSEDSKHGSTRRDPGPRVRALWECLAALHGLFGNRQFLLDHASGRAVPANQDQSHEIEVVICTTRGHHLLSELPIPGSLYTHWPTDAEPLLLGYECQAYLRQRLGEFDYYCFLEDDVILQDPWAFVKLGWFNLSAGDDKLLQPNRFEISPRESACKFYCDGDLRPHVTAPFQNVRVMPELSGQVLGTSVHFRRALNPHSGCYFLNAEQFGHWVGQPSFLDRRTDFIGPLESAATLGIMRTFKIYKPSPPLASFFEVKHFGIGYLAQVGGRIPVHPGSDPPDDRGS
jgi:hypothetical protein